MNSDNLILITGGARSGKSNLAQQLATFLGKDRVTYLATAEAGDEEMEERIARHRQERPESWKTVEAPVEITSIIKDEIKAERLILLDCLTLWLSNLLLQEEGRGGKLKEDRLTATIMKKMEQIINMVKNSEGQLLLVSNEVGLGVVPPSPLGRIYRDLNGRINKYVATRADRVFLCYCGLPLQLKPELKMLSSATPPVE